MFGGLIFALFAGQPLGKIFKKRDFTIEKQSPLKDFPMGLKSPHCIMIGLDPIIKKWVNYLSCIEGGMKDIFGILYNSMR